MYEKKYFGEIPVGSSDCSYSLLGCDTEVADEEPDSQEPVLQNSVEPGREPHLEYAQTEDEIQIELTAEMLKDMESVSYVFAGEKQITFEAVEE